MRSVQLRTSDGVNLEGDLALAPGEQRGAVVICHPHPRFGGNRHNTVVTALFDGLLAAGFAVLRFDFRAAHNGGVAERLDVVAALDLLDAETDGRLFVAGYSFGAAVALLTVDQRIDAIVAVAPPFGAMPVAAVTVPCLVLQPEHDQFCDPATAALAVTGWPSTTVETIGSTDHFLAGRTHAVAARAAAWFDDRVSAPLRG